MLPLDVADTDVANWCAADSDREVPGVRSVCGQVASDDVDASVHRVELSTAELVGELGRRGRRKAECSSVVLPPTPQLDLHAACSHIDRLAPPAGQPECKRV